MTTLILALAVGAPALKDPPKKELNVVGEWVVESQATGGRPLKSSADRRYHFTADGKWSLSTNGRVVASANRTYTVDPKASPPTIDMKLTPAAARPTYLGIVKIEGDRLYLCYSRGNDERPTKFESPEGTSVTLIIFRRSKPE